jgi:hypothetical protein
MVSPAAEKFAARHAYIGFADRPPMGMDGCGSPSGLFGTSRSQLFAKATPTRRRAEVENYLSRHVRLGSLADICAPLADVRLIPVATEVGSPPNDAKCHWRHLLFYDTVAKNRNTAKIAKCTTP